ncbi:hypothetical protein E2C01_092661 [Portunus trituberculatus]|uniref:Peptidase M12A domain-containing protein n=1 Tax=Portunus trituberculatus TaxID=210409 RepID=A0A5B7JR54_PORTR|nr:hypothetical protein [Portunus trituberculatus]
MAWWSCSLRCVFIIRLISTTVSQQPPYVTPPEVTLTLLVSPAESSERKIIKRAMNSLQESSCISFVPRSNHQNYIHIIKSAG